MAAGPAGQFVAVWLDTDPSFGQQLAPQALRASRYTPGSGWSAPVTVTAVQSNTRGTMSHALVMDRSGNAVLVFTSLSNGRQGPGGFWSMGVLLETQDDGQDDGQAELPALAIDDQGTATAVWQQNDPIFFPNLIVTRRVTASRLVPGQPWTAPVDIDFATGSGANGTSLNIHVTGGTPTTASPVGSVAINDAGVALLTLRRLPSVPNNVFVARCTPGTGWAAPDFLALNGDAARVLLAPDGSAVVAWDAVSGNSIYAVRGTAAGVWGAPSLVGGGFGTQIVPRCCGQPDAGVQ